MNRYLTGCLTGYDAWKTATPNDDPHGEQAEADEAAAAAKEQDWHWLAAEVAEFVKKYGHAALLRCVADGVGSQPSLMK